MTDTLPPVLDVAGLTVSFPGAGGEQRVVDGISFVHPGGRLALVGESGSGKSMTARALLGLVAAPGVVAATRLQMDGSDLSGLNESGWQRLRGQRIGLMLQDPRHALDPVRRIGSQVEEGLRIHRRLGRAERRDRALSMLEAVGMPDPLRAYRAYPHQLSGGMGQRAMLAATLIAEPRLLIADEPTSALDRELREQVLELIGAQVDLRGMALLLISHDLPQVAQHCEHVLVMHRGRLVESLPASRLADADHPYTRMLWQCRPSAATKGRPLPTLNMLEAQT
ncbi:ABC transporter ATP-binding protein [Paludibacterium yongneupense]|uniref:ABC transporter ATP-binding protein n=1 Tax=Paludibacterium yongneupense TaxID=400061 RepID=UPI000414B230|nr:ABC transporter ATP-binding protein [Paludibacterium yongneupense]